MHLNFLRPKLGTLVPVLLCVYNFTLCVYNFTLCVYNFSTLIRDLVPFFFFKNSILYEIQ